MSRRRRQINQLIRRELSHLLQRDVKDPRIKGIITVTDVNISPDLTQAKVFVSVMGSEQDKTDTFEGLAAASSFLRRELGERLFLRRIPELSFERDNSIEQGGRVLKLIEQVAAGNDFNE